MFITIFGGAASSKSKIAETVATKVGNNILYIATMKPAGDRANQTILRHQKLRIGKNLNIVERSKNIGLVNYKKYDTILIECMGNLLANEIFDGGSINSIYDGIEQLKLCKNIVVVTNDVFGEGVYFQPETLNYIKELGKLNRYLQLKSDVVVEVVYGIPIILKGQSVYEKYC